MTRQTAPGPGCLQLPTLVRRLALVAGAALASLAFDGCSSRADAQAGGPKGPAVSVAPAVQRNVSDSEDFSGRLEATDYVELRPRVSGTIDSVHFVDGASVRKGDLLFTIDPRPFEAEVQRAQSELVSARSKAELAQSELKRSTALLDAQAASKQEFEELSSSEHTSQADIAGAEAMLRVAKLNLEFTQVRAPISGHLSRANITVGNLVTPQSVLTSLTGDARIYAYFDASEQSYLRLRAETVNGTMPKVRLGLANETGFPHEGRLDFVDNRLDAQTGAIRLRATFDNASGQFTPGLAAHLRLESPVIYNAVMVPERAIGTDQTKKYVFVVAGDGQPQFREVKPGTLFEGMRVVEGSVKPGENVIVEGLQRVIPGLPVTPQVLKVDALGMPIVPAPAAKS
jgi:multidrug efflux system membrane fusion protein